MVCDAMPAPSFAFAFAVAFALLLFLLLLGFAFALPSHTHIHACFCIRSPGVLENVPDPAYTARLGIEQGCATLATPSVPTKLYKTFGG